MKPLFLQYPRCGTCRKAAGWLEGNNIDVTPRHIAEQNPSKEELAAWIAGSGATPQKFFNTSGKAYRELHLKEKVGTASNDELIRLLASDGMLVKRPILVTGDFVLVGFNESDWTRKLL